MPTPEQGLKVILKLIAANIKATQAALNDYGKGWDAEAKLCEHSQLGGDGLECSHPKQGNDPFCYSTNCPLTK